MENRSDASVCCSYDNILCAFAMLLAFHSAEYNPPHDRLKREANKRTKRAIVAVSRSNPLHLIPINQQEY
jgi:hypothetical protein